MPDLPMRLCDPDLINLAGVKDLHPRFSLAGVKANSAMPRGYSQLASPENIQK